MNNQQQVGLTRGLIVGVIALACSAGAYFCTHFVTANPNVQLAVAAGGMFLSSVAAMLGYGTADGRRAARNDVRKSDVGYNLIEKIRIK